MRVPPTIFGSIALAALFLALGVSPVPAAFAADFSSASFIARNPSTVDFGGTSTSSSFFESFSSVPISAGEASSTSFQIDSGPMEDLSSFSPQSQNWRWYDDESDETPVLPFAGENVAPAGVANANIIKLRLTIAETAGFGETGVKFLLQFATSSDFEYPQDVVEQGSCTGSSVWCYASGAGADNTVISTNVLSDSDPCSGGVGSGCGTHNESGVSTSTFTQSANAATEYEFTVEESGAAAGTVYFFRPVDTVGTSSVPLAAGASYPSLSTEGGTLTFQIDGLPAATSTSGVTTDIDTTSTSIPFGALPFGTSTIAAHRLTVTTNAANGYQIFAYEQQNLIDQSDAEIPAVSATNDDPSSWSDGCTATSTGCWGYHTAADVLSGGSTRFAPDDTYAGFSSDPSEIAYSSGPVTDQSTDMVYRLQVSHEQDPGDYSTDLVYIVTPVF